MNFFPFIQRKFQSISSNQFRTFFYRKVQKGCECPEVKDETVVVEKSCKPCSFRTWKPKTTRTLKKEIVDQQCPKPPLRCYPGMTIKRPHSDCKKEAIDPHKKKLCLDQPPRKSAKKTPPKPVQRIVPLPEADWEVN